MTQPEMIHGLLRPMAERIERLEATNAGLLAALEVLADWPRRSATVDGALSVDPAVGLANVRRFARDAIAKAERD